jgi:hypothetical protein
MNSEGIAAIAVVIGVVIGLPLLLAFPFMWLWNYAVVAALTVAKPITFWPAFWLMVFISALTSSRSGKKS